MTGHELARRAVRTGSPVRFALFLSLVVSTALLAGCAEESSEDRRFANEPAPTEDRPTATTVAVEATEEVAPTVVHASPATLLEARGAPDRIYTAVGQQLWAIENAQPRQIPLPPGLSIQAFDASPSGDRVAVVGVDAAGSVLVVILDAAGTPLRSVTDVIAPSASPGATPTAEAGDGPQLIVDWGLQGDTILVANAAGQATALPVEGQPRAVPMDLQGGRLLAAQISPRGDEIALLRHDQDGVARLVVMPLLAESGEEPRLVAPREGQAGRTVESMAWLPDGGSLLYVEGTAAGDGTGSVADLFSVRLAGLERRLVATGGEAGPAGTILEFQASPDGESVAYVVGIPDGDDVSVHSSWIVSLGSPIEYRLPTEPSANVTRLWWTSDGLIWGVEPVGPVAVDTVTVNRVGSDGAQEALFTITAGQSPATPVAGTPIASPIASPIAGATPDS